MKQSLFSKKLASIFSKLDVNNSYILDGFHLDFFLSLYHSLRVPVFILLPDNLFDLVLKHLSVLHENCSVVFIPPYVDRGDGPAGFFSESSFHIQRTRALFSSGVGSVSFIVCSESGLSIPVLGPDGAGGLTFSSGVGFDACLNFFSTHNYSSVDMVLSPGEFCVRGGIIDVYPFSMSGPARISFLDEEIDVQGFDVQSQLTTGVLDNFTLVAPQDRDMVPLKDFSFSNILRLYYDPDEQMNINNAVPVYFSKSLGCVSFNSFGRAGEGFFNSVLVDENLSSVGVVDNSKDIIVPPWFISAPTAVSRFSDPNKTTAPSLALSNIKRGDYLVHRDHGVGVCVGLVGSPDGDMTQEFLSLKYEDGGIIRVDSGRLDLVDFYADAGSEDVSLDSLQKKAGWSRKRRAAKIRAEETIEYLLNLYVRRKDVSRSAFVSDNSMENQFLNDFPYEDTDDQITAWQEISNDLSSSAPMDRLLCGDVGFGKTEIALRAAFRVVLGGRRVLVLAPTTILVNQLFTSFCARLGPYAVNVELVSRFRSSKNIAAVQNDILSEKNDVLVGTHSILNNDIYLKNIGLLIIDEEHRFGVRQKESIKCFKDGVDVLSMSATPIPRSLNMALSGIYSISLLQTPPLMRLPIITRTGYFNETLIKEAVSFEVGRGGQIYFVHNNIQSIKSVTDLLRGLFPDLYIIFIHGQESPRDIEKKMGLFVSESVNVLVCTSIIEAGIDVPNANCIIINNAHLFGLSQLYQIRGRVGRGNRQAYAYLMIPSGLHLSDKAFGRIKAIEENTRLGSGYNISQSDMGLRGSGSLFGYSQSGGSGSVGYEMYLRLIRRALHDSGGLTTDFMVLPEDVVIKVFGQRHIPDDYISHESLRLSFYKNLSSAVNESGVNNIVYHLINRFGPIPLSVNNLVYECRLRILAASVGVLSIQMRECGVVCDVVKNDDDEFASAFIDCVDNFFGDQGVVFHFLPLVEEGLSVCLHISNKVDKYALLSRFLNKLKALI